MSINQIREKIKSNFALIVAHEKELFVAGLIILTALFAFGLGRLAKIEDCREPVQIEGADLQN